MPIVVTPKPRMPFTQWLDQLGLTAQVKERDLSSARYTGYAWMAHIPYVEIMEHGMLRSPAGNGRNPEEALVALAAQLSGQRIAIEAYTPDRAEHQVPYLTP